MEAADSRTLRWFGLEAAAVSAADLDRVRERVSKLDARVSHLETSDGEGRALLSVTTASIAVASTWEGTVAIGRGSFTVIKVETSSPARVRIHASAAHRTADLARTSDVMPSGNHGVLLDVETDSGALEVNPTMLGGSLEIPVSTSFPITVKRLSGSTGPLTVTLTVI